MMLAKGSWNRHNSNRRCKPGKTVLYVRSRKIPPRDWELWHGVSCSGRHSKCLRIVEIAEEFGFRRAVFGNRAAHPGDLHIVLEADVLIRDIAAPDAAAHARGHRHSVRKRA